MTYCTISAVKDVSTRSNGVRLECELDRRQPDTLAGQQEADGISTDRTVPVRIRFYNPLVFRFELHGNPEKDGHDSLIDLNEDEIAATVNLDVSENEDTITIDSDALRITIGKDEWSFTVERSDGRTLFAEQRGDVDAKGRRRVDSLGFSETEINNWPLKISSCGTAFRLVPDEHIFGLGEKFTDFDKRGQRIFSWNTQPNGSETEEAYKNVPFYLSSQGYGFLVETTNRVEFDIGNTSSVSGEITVHDDSFEYVFFGGPSFKEILKQYTGLTGRPNRPPKWSFGIWMSKYGYRNREELEAAVDRLRDTEIPCDVMHLDPYWMEQGHECDLEWDTESFPRPEEMIEQLHERDIQLSLWENPYVAVGTEAFETARDKGYLVRDHTGEPYILDRLSISSYRAGIVDFTNPSATEWWKQKHKKLLEMGVDVFKTDFGEYLPRDAVFENNRTGKAMRNIYPHLYQEAVHEITSEVKGENDALVWARSGWIGSQRFPVHWAGDNQTTFESMAAVLRGGLSLLLSGYSFWSHDIGGFKGTPSEKLYIRSSQFGLLSSHARYHGTTPREPWNFGEEAVGVVKKFASIRYKLLPYLYSYAEIASKTGLPVMRPLVLEFQDDPAVFDLATEYLLGESLLIAPVFSPTDEARIYLPEGEWIDFWNGQRYDGQRTIERNVPLDEMPIFFRADSIIPMGEPGQSVQTGTSPEVSLEIFLVSEGQSEAAFEFYDEDSGRPVSLRAEVPSDRTSLHLTSSDRPELFTATVSGFDSAPDTVTVNETPLSETESDPDPGQWSYDNELRELAVNYPS